VGVLPQSGDYPFRYRKRRLTKPQLDDIPALGTELVAEFIDTQGGWMPRTFRLMA